MFKIDYERFYRYELKLSNNVVDNNILLYEGYNPDVPIRAWAVHIPLKDNSIKILVSEDKDGLNTPSQIGLKSGAAVIINGGYFSRVKTAVILVC